MQKLAKWKRLIALVVLVLLVFTMIATSIHALAAEPSTSDYHVWIADDADLLTDSEEAALEKVMAPITAYGSVGFYSTNENTYTSTKYMAEAVLHDHSGYGSGTVFVIDMDERNIFIYSDGAMLKTINTAKANTITDNIYTYASKQDYYTCAATAYQQINTVLEGGRIAEPMKIASNAVLAILIGMLVCFWYVMVSSNLHKASDAEIISGATCNFNNKILEAKKTHTTKTYDPPVSSSGGGGGGGFSGGGGGGGHSGGGGGHSF